MIFTPDKCQKEPNGSKLDDTAQERARRPPQPVGSTLLLCEGTPDKPPPECADQHAHFARVYGLLHHSTVLLTPVPASGTTKNASKAPKRRLSCTPAS